MAPFFFRCASAYRLAMFLCQDRRKSSSFMNGLIQVVRLWRSPPVVIAVTFGDEAVHPLSDRGKHRRRRLSAIGLLRKLGRERVEASGPPRRASGRLLPALAGPHEERSVLEGDATFGQSLRAGCGARRRRGGVIDDGDVGRKSGTGTSVFSAPDREWASGSSSSTMGEPPT
jgi:hypothetical protein